jgi:hypothetical protein
MVGNNQLDILSIDTLWEEGDHSKKLSGIRAEFSEHRGGEGKFDRGGEAPGVLCVKHSRSLFSHSLVSRSVSHLLYWATVASKVTERGWKSSRSRMSLIRSDCSLCL